MYVYEATCLVELVLCGSCLFETSDYILRLKMYFYYKLYTYCA